MSQQEIIQLLDRYLAGTATIPEQERAEAWLDDNEDLNNDWEHMDDSQRTDFLSNLYQKIKTSIQDQDAPVVPIRRRSWIKWVAAACIIALVGVLVFQHYVGVPANNKGSQTATTHDIAAPKETRAVITLANGSKVYLDSVNSGTIAQENNVNVVRGEDGGIKYLSPAGGANSEQRTANSPTYNTLFNPRGSKVISLTLSDGTKVWLNSESSLRYPASFAPSALNREVEITGEAYFEVKHNAKQPFKVHLPNGSTVEDIGTSFNINAYPDEDGLKTTLVEGSVRLSPAGGGDLNASPNYKRPGVVLKPGQQAILNQANPLILPIKVQTVNVDDVLAWKNGLFAFTDAGIQTVMIQIARWYDVEVVYQEKPTKIFRGSIPRDMSAANVFKALEETGGVHFKIEGKKVIVMR